MNSTIKGALIIAAAIVIAIAMFIYFGPYHIVRPGAKPGKCLRCVHVR